jgi:trigger factor
VPPELAEKHIPREDVYQQLMRSYIPKVYQEVVNKEQLKPIISPKVDLKKAKENEDWEMIFTLAEKPTVELKNYKEAVIKAKKEVKPAAPEIIVPGKTQQPQDPQKKEAERQQELLNKALDAVLKEVKCEISELLIEEELNQRLTRLVDDIQKLGLTTDGYLKSKNLTMDDLKMQFTKEIEEMYKMEFILMAIADDAKINVEQADLDKLFGSISNEKEKAEAQQNAYFYASILRKQKTLDYLAEL